ncbi:nectin-4-like [Salarias fasciatus]|uniref:nectin-4-like n=1 Tax=Salarias fasciatus TaxID=181472 RepID=UPI001176EB5D|nr:nectin-4-like [Salarias fasciatus]
MVIDFRKKSKPSQPLCMLGEDVEEVEDYKYLGVKTPTLYRKRMSRIYFLRNLRSFNMRSKMLEMFYQSVEASVSVTGGNLTVVEGHDVTLPCKMTEQEKTLTQISWRRKTRGMPGNPFFFTISEENGQSFVDDPDPRISVIGHFAERDGTLQISNVSLNDEGRYRCIFSLFPSGTYSKKIPLQVQVPPATSLNSTLLILGNEEVLLATCTAAASRPAAQLRWITGALEKNLRETTSVTEHDNGTTTTVSSLFGVPRREISGHEVQCVVSSSALAEEHREAFTLQVFFPPMNVTIVETSDDTLECVSEGNPEPSVRWTRSDKTLPESDFRVDGGKLTFLRKASELKGFYQCEVSNPYGQQSQQVYWTVVSGEDPASHQDC